MFKVNVFVNKLKHKLNIWSFYFSEQIIMADAKEPLQSVQTFGRKKNATAVAYCKRGKGLLKVNGRPLEEVEPKALQYKLQEPLLLLGKDRFADVDIRIRVKGGGHTSQIYAIRQALSKSLVAYYQKCKSDFGIRIFEIGTRLGSYRI